MPSLNSLYSFPYASPINREYIELPYAGFIEVPELNTYTILTPTERWIVKNIRLKVGSGSCVVTASANDIPVAGLTDLTVNTASQLIAPTESIQYLEASTPLKLTIVSAEAGTTNLEYTITLTVPGSAGDTGSGSSSSTSYTDRLISSTTVLSINDTHFVKGVAGNTRFLEIFFFTGNNAFGYGALSNVITGGNNNSAFGHSTMASLTTGSNNVAMGTGALQSNLTQGQNTAIGYFALADLTDNGFATAVGYRAARANVNSSGLTAIGNNAFQAGTNISGGTAVGSGAGYSVTTGQTNTVLGNDTLFNTTIGGANTAIGYKAAHFNQTGSWNVAVGRDALRGVSGFSHSDNTAIGSDALGAVTIGGSNVAVGRSAANTLTSGSNNIVIGKDAQPSADNVSNEITLGDTSITKLRVPGVDFEAAPNRISFVATYTTASQRKTFNIGVFSNLDPNAHCVGIGPDTLSSALGNTAHTTALGTNALKSLTEGLSNTAIGSNAMAAAVGAPYDSDGLDEVHSNTAVGSYALDSLIKGLNNIAIGSGSAESLVRGNGNIILASSGAGLSEGSNNIVLGGSTSSFNISNEITLGNSAHTSLRCAVTTITALSDARDKTNIVDLPLGLDFISTLRPVKFDWNTRDGARTTGTEAGFIAQELDEASQTAEAEWLGLVSKNNPDRLEASPGKLLPVAIKAIQELQAQVASLTARLEALEA